METDISKQNDSSALFCFERARLNNLFLKAIQYPLVMVCGGTGYGKTSSVYDFTHQYKIDTAWIQLSERDNVGGRFWESYTKTLAQVNPPLARASTKVGFPDTAVKLSQYIKLIRHYTAEMKQQIIVMDDFHFIKAPAVLRFVERLALNVPQEKSIFLISRSTPCIAVANMVSSGRVFTVSEEDLRFTEDELTQYFKRLGISFQTEGGDHKNTLHNIIEDTKGWAFAINLIARSFRNMPWRDRDTSVPLYKTTPYTGYLRTAMKSNIFRLLESEIWEKISGRLQQFLLRISLIDHLSADLILLLAENDSNLITELEQQSEYVRCDIYINAYLIHPLFLEFLSGKGHSLSQEHQFETYAVAGAWCNKNGFKIDAISYYEKIKDYEAIVKIFIMLPAQIPQDIACYTELVLNRAPEEVFNKVLFLASTHLRSIMCQGYWEKAIELAHIYEKKYLTLAEDNIFKKATLASIYYCCAISRQIINLTGNSYDFDKYFKKLDECFDCPVEPKDLIKRCPGPWICVVGSSEKGAVEKFIAALKRSVNSLTHCLKGFDTGEDKLAMGELKFYQGDTGAAELHIARALDCSLAKRQFEVRHRSFLYTMRIAAYDGNYHRLERVLQQMKEQLGETEYQNRFTNYDISLSWYYCILGIPEKIPEWLKDIFFPYSYAGFIENFANQIKARYHYMTKNYAPLLSYIEDMRQRESFLFGRLEMLAIEACIHHKMRNMKKACLVLKEAYETAIPNNILMPFIELGKDMRTLTGYALKNRPCSINKKWLELVNRKSSAYAKRLAHVIADYKNTNEVTEGVVVSAREVEILTDLSHGLSRTEIATSRGLSINTVKMVITSVFDKLGVESLPDAIRIAIKRKII